MTNDERKSVELEALHMAHLTHLVEIFSKYLSSPLAWGPREKTLRADLDDAERSNKTALDIIEVRGRARAGGTAVTRSSCG